MIGNNNNKKNSKTRAPAFQFYASDWLTDPALRMCSLQARGLWIELLCIMYLAPEVGVLMIGNQVLNEESVCNLIATSKKVVRKSFAELQKFDVIKRDEQNRFYSKRMKEDEALRLIRREVGKLGGNPKLKEKYKLASDLVEVLDNQTDNQKQTPSSSSSSSSSLVEKKDIKKEDHELQIFINANCVELKKLKQQLSFEQAEKLLSVATQTEIQEVFLQMENFKLLASKYTSVFLTANNWIKRKKNESTSNNNNNRQSDFEDALRNI
jgi:hypothetical protein